MISSTQPGGDTLVDQQGTRQARTRRRIVRWAIAVALLICLLAPVSYGAVSAYGQYTSVRSEASDGILQLKHALALVTPYTKHPGIPSTATLRAVQRDLVAADRDFAKTRHDLGGGFFSLAARASGSANGTLTTVSTLVTAADEACLAGLDLLGPAITVLPALQGSLVAPGAASTPTTTTTAASTHQTPTLSAAMFQQLTTGYEDAVRHLNTAIVEMSHADFSTLPSGLITPQQMTELRTAIAQWPRIQPQLATVDAWLRVAPALLGVDTPERFLVELMDRGELRTTGGYIGDYGVMTIQRGKLMPFTLNDIQSLDRPYEARVGWPDPPAAYPWWPFPGFGLRDSNLSPDFPTTARLGINLLAKEGGPHVQGVIALNVVAMERVLAVMGPVEVPGYHVSATAQNLELLIREKTETTYLNNPVLHEKFTAELGQAFMARVHTLRASQYADVAKALLASLHTKDIQVYLSDPAAESLVAQQGFADTLDRGPGDGITIVDSNVGINKVNMITSVTYTDTVTLDTRGTATHHLTITYSFDSAKHPDLQRFLFFGRNFYITYLRVYTPPNARLASYGTFNGTYFNRSYQQIGTSDEHGRQMWGGYVYVRDAIAYSLHFVWSVPGIATRDASGHLHYVLEMQHQAGSNQQLDLRILVPDASAPAVVYRGALDQDRTYSVTY